MKSAEFSAKAQHTRAQSRQLSVSSAAGNRNQDAGDSQNAKYQLVTIEARAEKNRRLYFSRQSDPKNARGLYLLVELVATPATTPPQIQIRKISTSGPDVNWIINEKTLRRQRSCAAKELPGTSAGPPAVRIEAAGFSGGDHPDADNEIARSNSHQRRKTPDQGGSMINLARNS